MSNLKMLLAVVGASVQLVLGVKASRTVADLYATGIALGELNAAAGLELVAGSGSDLDSPPLHGTVQTYKADGSSLWTYNSPGDDYVLGLDIADIDNDGNNEVLVGYHMAEHVARLLTNAGTSVWTFDNGTDNYVRAIKIAELDSGHAGKEAVVGGRNGTLHLLDKNGSSIWSKTGTTSLCYPSCDGGSATTVQSVDVADTDIDGQKEILVAYNQYVRKYDYTGTQAWSTTVGDSDSFAYGVAAGDVTNATGLEIAAAVANLGAGAIDAVKLLDKDGAVIWSRNFSDHPWSVAIADVNGDGQNEIIVGHGTRVDESPSKGGVTVLDKNGHQLSAIALPNAVIFVLLGDADNDGRNEIVASCNDGKVYIIGINQ